MKRGTRIFRGGFRAALSLWMIVTSSSAVIAADKVIITHLPNIHGLPLFVALERKMFEREGLTVEVVKFENPNQIIDSIVANRADIGAGGPAGTAALAQVRFPDAIKVIGLQGYSDQSGTFGDTLITKNDSAIKNFSDLKGKKIGVLPGVQFRAFSRAIARANGINPDSEIEFVEMALGLQVQAVASGSVDAAFTIEPVGAIAANSKQVRVIAENLCSKYIADPFFAGASFASAKFLKERPEVAKKVIGILDEAAGLLRSDFGAYRQYLIGYTAITAVNLGAVRPMYYAGSRNIDPASIAAYQKLADIIVAEGLTKDPLNVSTLMLSAN